MWSCVVVILVWFVCVCVMDVFVSGYSTQEIFCWGEEGDRYVAGERL